jgi:hypothetical protein
MPVRDMNAYNDMTGRQMMNRKAVWLVVMVAVVAGLSCSDDPRDPVSPEPTRIIGSGDMVTEARTVAEFTGVVLDMVGSVAVNQGASVAVSVTVDDNIMQYVETAVIDGRLVIRPRGGVIISEYDLDVDITIGDVEELTVEEVGSITTGGIVVEDLSLNINGVGSITTAILGTRLSTNMAGVGSITIFDGWVAEHDCDISSTGSLSAYDFFTDTTRITISGSGSAEVRVQDRLEVGISGSGNVYYLGSPSIFTAITGTGSVIDAN